MQKLQGCQNFNLNENEIANPYFSEESFSKQDASRQDDITADSVPEKVHRTIYYEIKSDKSFKKGTMYSLSKDNQVIYTAKLKGNDIYIGEGIDFNIKENDTKDTVKITRCKNGYNIINTGDQEIKVNYIQIGNYNSLNVSFKHNGKQLNWIPRQPKSKIGLHGGYGRVPIQSKKNTMLQNLQHRLSFICREMPKKIFEAECNKDIDPRIVFAIALSQIIGPLLK